MPVQHLRCSGQAQHATSPVKNQVTSKSPVGDISVVTLIRTDTTLDHSQKAEKVWQRIAFASLSTGYAVAAPAFSDTTISVEKPGRTPNISPPHRHSRLVGWQLLTSKLPHEKYCYG
jgi:hypothetical protein